MELPGIEPDTKAQYSAAELQKHLGVRSARHAKSRQPAWENSVPRFATLTVSNRPIGTGAPRTVRDMGTDADEPTAIHERTPSPEPALAYSDALDIPDVSSRRWLPTALFACAVIAVAVAAVSYFLLRAPARHASPPAPPVATSAPEHDDDAYVAIAVSPRTRDSAYGVSSTQERADKIAVSQCVAGTSDDQCVVVARMHHGCAAIAVGASGAWAGGTGASDSDAKMKALENLPGDAQTMAAKCSK